MDILPCFKREADALARLIALAREPGNNLADRPDPDVVRLLAEALQSAYDANH